MIARCRTARVLSTVCFAIGLLALPSGCSPKADPDEARVAADNFLSQIIGGETELAWKETTSEFKSYMGADRLKSLVRSSPALRAEAAEFRDCTPANVEGLNLMQCDYLSHDEKHIIRVLLDHDGQRWRVERVYVEPAES